MESNSEDQLTLFVEASPVKTSQSQGKRQGSMASGQVYTAKCLELLARVDQDTQYLKTSQDCLFQIEEGGSQNFSMTWPRSGMMRNGTVFRLPTLAPLTGVIESGLLPTIGKNEGKGASRNRYRGSKHFRGAKMSEGLRTCREDPIYTHPSFAEAAMGFPKGWTDLQDSATP